MPFLSSADIAGALHGLSRVLRFDKEGFEYFDASARGLLKSFWLAVVVLPLYLIGVGLDLSVISDTQMVLDPVRYVIVKVIAYVIGWVAFPLAILTLSETLGFGSRVFHFLVPFNWLYFMVWNVLFPLKVVAHLGVLPTDFALFLTLITIVVALIYFAFLAREGLQVSWWSAVGVLVLSLTIDIFIETLQPLV